jgi:ribosome maturation factor RimP
LVSTDLDARLNAIIAPVVAAMGLDLVRIQLLGQPGNLTLQVMAEDPATGQMTLDQCASVSRALDLPLEEADPIASEYALEVSSPGIDRPLTRLKDFEDWAHYEARVETTELINGRRRFKGMLRGTEGDEILIEIEEAGAPLTIGLKFDWLSDAKLILTEALIADMLHQRKAGELDDETEFDEIDHSDGEDEAEDGLDAPETRH